MLDIGAASTRGLAYTTTVIVRVPSLGHFANAFDQFRLCNGVWVSIGTWMLDQLFREITGVFTDWA
jgi:hypothetical protein